MPPRTDGERLAVLETEMKVMQETLNRMSTRVEEMHAVLLQAKGARWAIVGLATLSGGIAGFFIKLMPFIGSKP